MHDTITCRRRKKKGEQMKKTHFIKITAFSSCILLSASMFLTLGASAAQAQSKEAEVIAIEDGLVVSDGMDGSY